MALPGINCVHMQNLVTCTYVQGYIQIYYNLIRALIVVLALSQPRESGQECAFCVESLNMKLRLQRRVWKHYTFSKTPERVELHVRNGDRLF